MIKHYRHYSASESYIVGFVYKHDLYVIELNEIAPRYMRIERQASSKGGHQQLRLRLNNAYMEQLIRKGAELIGNEDLLIGDYNKGIEFERLIHERHNIEWGGHNNKPFYMGGDININGVEIQIKLNGAQMVVENTLENLKKRVDR